MLNTTHTIRRVITTDVARVDDLLNSAVKRLIPEALALGFGIKVTRIGPGDYTVETARDIACGYTVYEHPQDGA